MMEMAVGLLLLLLLLGAVLWAGGGKIIHDAQGSGIIESIPDALEREPAPQKSLVVLSYRLAYGLGTQPTGASPADAVMLYDRLDRIVETIALSDADVALLQEVDFASQRTHDIDQLHYIAAALGWGFAARAITWECRYLPWPLRRPAGRLRAGMGVISRYPLVQNTRRRLSQSRAQFPLAPLFLPYHTVQMVDVQCGSQTVRLFNVHLETRHMAVRQRQARELVAFVQQFATPTSVIMGAFNIDRSGASETSTETNHDLDQTMPIITNGLRDRFRLATDDRLTHPAVPPHSHRTYILTGTGTQALETRFLTLHEPVSDHLPMVAHLRWFSPIVIHDGRSKHEPF